MKTYPELVEKLKEIKKMGWVKTHRRGTTGIGKTIEDLLDIPENNVPGPDGEMVELKSGRKNSKSMLTLFTLAPLPRKANSVLLQKFGYSSKHTRRKVLHTTVSTLSFNILKGKEVFKVVIKDDKVELIAKTSDGGIKPFLEEKREEPKIEVVGYWNKEILRNSFERKLPRLLYVKANSRGSGENEEFLFNEAWLLSRFDFENFLKLLKEGTILADIRIGQYPSGKPHDHGTGFRVLPDKLDLCFSNRKKVL